MIVRHHRPYTVPRRALWRRTARPFSARELARTVHSHADRADRLDRLPIDVYSTPEAYVVTANLPGVDPNDVEITVEGTRLSIKAALPERTDEKYLLRERRTGELERTLTFETPIESGAVEATFAHGVIELTVPKSPESLPRKIKVAAA